MLLFGGETLKDFAFALLVGIASGTYSSIFIASPVLTAWKEREAVYVQRRRRVIESFGLVPAFAVATSGGVTATPVAAGGARHETAREPDGRTPLETEDWEAEEEAEEPESAVEDVLDEDVVAGVTGDGRAGGEDAAQSQREPRRSEPKKRSRQRRRKHGRRR